VSAAHAFHGLVWCAVLILMWGSIPRTMRGKARWADGTWAIVWCMSIIQLGYTVRWLLGMAMDHAPGVDVGSAGGLLVFSGLVAVGLIRRRILIDGWRW
jgi:hypothetical protein